MWMFFDNLDSKNNSNEHKRVDVYVSCFVAKLLRADGGCLGVKRRRRTRQAAISFGERLNRL
jgi:hypothetical protein